MELASIILDGVESGGVMIHKEDDDARILLAAAARRPGEVWEEIAGRLESRSWRIRIQIQGWLLSSVPTEVVEGWIGQDAGRGRIVAGIAPVREDRPPALVRYLLETFRGDQEIEALAGNFQSGFWMGPESSHLAGLIEQLNGWRGDEHEPLAVREWARNRVAYLERRKAAAAQEEAEERF